MGATGATEKGKSEVKGKLETGSKGEVVQGSLLGSLKGSVSVADACAGRGKRNHPEGEEGIRC